MNTLNTFQKVLFESKHLALCVLDKSEKITAANHTFQKHFGKLAFDPSQPKSVRSLSFWSQDFRCLDLAMEELFQKGFASFSQHLYYGNTFVLCEIDLKQITATGEVLMEVLPKQHKGKESKNSIGPGVELDGLASIISHELRAPVANMAYLLSIFKEELVHEEELGEFVEALKKSNEKTLNIIDEMGEMVNMKLQKGSISSRSLQSMLSGVIEKFDDEISNTKARVVVDIHDRSDWKLPQGAFQMILSQVISNSLKYRKVDETPKIVITCSRKNGDRLIEVSDNGLGFDAVGNKHRLFGLFQTFHNHPDSRGIGLFQVKNRLLSIGGAVSLDSQKGMGTTVTLNFKQNELEKAPLYH